MLNANEVGYQSQSPSIITDNFEIFPEFRISFSLCYLSSISFSFRKKKNPEISPKGVKNGFRHYRWFSGSFAHWLCIKQFPVGKFSGEKLNDSLNIWNVSIFKYYTWESNLAKNVNWHPSPSVKKRKNKGKFSHL